ncbi:MAG: GNAT family N-acetyltransferase [Pirellulales bacterium]|nr:GNAT family N-acetyltransferase [Pirellulales bacterium]
MQTTELGIRTMELPDLGMALEWAAAEGWNPGNCDAGPFFAADPRGFFMAERDGLAVGSVSAVAYDERFGFLGLYIVRPDCRGQGYGRAVFQAGMDYLGDRTVGLDGVPVQEEYYRRHGFQFAYRTFRYEGTSNPNAVRSLDCVDDLIDLRTLPLEVLTAYDAEIFPASRPAFLEAWINQPGTVALGLQKSGRLAGYGVLRPCRVGCKIGPLMADDPTVAAALFEGLLSTVPGETVYFDVPEPNQPATDLATRHGMTPVFNTARMYRGTPPSLDLARTFGVTTLELG